MRRIGALLAAGQSTRFGAGDKLLAPCRGRPLVAWAAEALLASGCEELVAVVASPQVADALPSGFALHHLPPGLPMSESFRVALTLARDAGASGLLMCLGDMPNISPALLRGLMALPGSGACLHAGRRLPPAWIAAADFARALATPPGDHGARAIIAGLPPDRLIPIDATTAHDVDRPDDLTEG